MRRGRRWIVALAALAVPLSLLAWWLVSPLFISSTVLEEFPLTGGATIPENMTRAEAEAIMAEAAEVRQEASEDMPSGAVTRLRAGSFRDADSFHRGSGNAVLYRLPDGGHLLRLERINVTNGPDLHVILTPHPDPKRSEDVHARGYVELGSLKGNVGTQNYPVPAGADLPIQRTAVIYCKPFRVVFATAALGEAN